VIKAIHGVTGKDSNSMAHPRNTGMWLNIVKAGMSLIPLNLNLDKLFTRVVGNGVHTNFWVDRWVGTTSLNCLFPDLYILESDKSCSIVDQYCYNTNNGASWEWSWFDNNLVLRLSDRILELQSIASNITLSNSLDHRKWEGIPRVFLQLNQ